MSKSSRLSRDLSACIATRQIGQWRMVGRRDVVIGKYIVGIDNPAFDPDQCGCRSDRGGQSQVLRANDLDQGATRRARQVLAMWQPASNAPFDCDLELAVIDRDGQHALVFPCRRIPAAGLTLPPGTGWTCDRPLAPLGGQALTLLLWMSTRFRVADFGFFFGQQSQQDLSPRLVGFDGEKPPIVLDIHIGDGSVHNVVPVWSSTRL